MFKKIIYQYRIPFFKKTIIMIFLITSIILLYSLLGPIQVVFAVGTQAISNNELALAEIWDWLRIFIGFGEALTVVFALAALVRSALYIASNNPNKVSQGRNIFSVAAIYLMCVGAFNIIAGMIMAFITF